VEADRIFEVESWAAKRDDLYRKLNWDAFYKTGAECKHNMPSYYK